MEDSIREFAKGQVIFAEGAVEMFMYDLLQGTVGIYVGYGEEGERCLAVLRAEDKVCFGEMGLLEAMPRSATAVALEDVRLYMIDGRTFGHYFRDNPEAILRIMRQISQRIRTLTNNYLDACRAVSEALDTEKTGEEKSNWFVGKVIKFLRDHNNTAKKQWSGQDEETHL